MICLELPSRTHNCKKLATGRLFKTSSKESFSRDFDTIESHTLYTVSESTDRNADINPKKSPSEDIPSHPLCDMFFCSDDRKDLFLVSVTGGDGSKAKARVKKLQKFVEEENQTQNEMKLHGVSLAPNVRDTNTVYSGNVLDLRGAAAVKQLGGLAQISNLLFK